MKQLKETRSIQKQTLIKLDAMEIAMNELEAMKSSYKKVLQGNRRNRTSLSQLGSTINKESGSNSNLEKTLSGYSNFSVTKKKEKKELALDPE